MPSVDLFEDMRASEEVYCFYCYFFLPHVAGKRKFLQAIQKGGKLSEIVMESDEAFGIVAILNASEKWTWEAKHSWGTVASWELKDRPGLKFSVGYKSNAKKYEGWNAEGTKKFNELVDKVKRDREYNKTFDDYFMKKIYIYSKGKHGEREEIEHEGIDMETEDEAAVMQLEEV
jgi:hypothetical protein